MEDMANLFTSEAEMEIVLENMQKTLKMKTSIYQRTCPEGQTCTNGTGTLENYKTMFGTGMNPYSFGGYAGEAGNNETYWYSLDGSTVFFRANTFMDIFLIYVFVDVNGENSPPNILGKDFLALVITPKGACAIGADCGYMPELFDGTCTSEKEFYADSKNGMHYNSPISGIGCSAELLLK